MIADGLNIKENIFEKLLAALITFVPPLLFAAFYPDGFILALGYAGVIVALIHGVLPALMVWRGRYHLRLSQAHDYRVFGGKSLILLVIIFSVVIIVAAIAGYCGWQPHV
jgi:tyrosine-specific transport protein